MLNREGMEDATTLRRMLVLSALLPPPVSLDILTEVGGCAPVKALRLLEDLTSSGLLKPCGQGGAGYYQFCDSARALEVIAREEPALVCELGAALIRHLSQADHPEDKAALAIANVHHLAGLPVSDARPLLRAADYCLKLGAREAAAIYYRLALEARGQTAPNPREAAERVASALGMLAACGHRMPLEQQEQTLKQAREYALQLNDQGNLCQIHLRLGQIRKLRGDYRGAGRLFEKAWHLAVMLGGDQVRKEAALLSADFLFWQGRVSAAVARYEEVLGDLEEFPNEEAVLRACVTLGWCYGICGQTARGLGLMEAVRQKARTLGFRQAEMDSYVMSALALIDAGYVSEAGAMVAEVFKFPEEELGNYRLWASYAARGYLRHLQGDLAGCFRDQQRAYAMSKEIGWPHHRGPYNFDYMEVLEDAGMVHPEMNYESELRRVAEWPDIYMQGVGLRYQARRMQRQGHAREAVLETLERSQALLTQAGARLELARTQVELAKLHLAAEDEATARRLLREAWETLSATNEDLFPYALRPYLETEPAEERIIRVMTELGNAVGTVRDRKNLLERVINLLMKLTLAGRGGFFVQGPEGWPQLSASRNLEQALVESPGFRSSLELILSAFHQPGPAPEALASAQGSLPGARPWQGWALCRRVSLQGELLGVIYLDNTLVEMTPPAKVLTFLDLIINHVAVALDNARAYEEINALKERLEDETRLYRTELQCSANVGQMVGRSPAMARVMDQIRKVAPSDTTVLICGETGVGKELVARAIHSLGQRREGPFIPVDTASLDPGVVASELFGHEKGAFTGAASTRRGRFELADRGTLFLDDVDNLPLEVQAKLLRALQEREFQRVGGNKLIRSDFRLIAATNQDLEALVERGGFRSDLYYRLNVFPVVVPPLRQRRDDIPLLAAYFMEKFSLKMGKNVSAITKRDLQRLKDYPWPGNVRELKHVIERGVILSEGETLSVADLDAGRGLGRQAAEFSSLLEMERGHILAALARCEWRVSGKGGAAELLGLKPTTLYSKLKKLGISKQLQYS